MYTRAAEKGSISVEEQQEIQWNWSLQNISDRYENKTTSSQLIILCNEIAKWNRCLSISQLGWHESQMPIS